MSTNQIEDTSSGPGIVGSLLRRDGEGVVRMEDTFDTDVDDLWSAVTTPERLARWVATVEGDLRVGGEVHASFTSGWDGPGLVEVCEAPRRLRVRMAPGQGEPEETVIEAVLEPVGDRTRLTIEERGLPVDVLWAHGAGWQTHFEDLATHLAGREPAPWRERWTELKPAYDGREVVEG